uniref:Uncharacterized protein n=1 Tax=Canis lupus familiaris TaxID=9615 RepID=A0A8P0P837_CANLF
YIGLPAWSLLLPLPVSLSLLFYFRTVCHHLPQSCNSTMSPVFYKLLCKSEVPLCFFFHLFHWLGIKKFQHN